MRARSALFTLFGDIVRPAGGEAWLTTLTECMGALGFSPEATRTALHRMATDGWVTPRRVGRYAAYRLTEKGMDRLDEAAERIYRLRAAAWDGRWRLIVGEAASRDEGLAKELTWMGFGRLSPEVWISPHAHGDRLAATLAQHGVRPAVTVLTTEAHDRDHQDTRIVAEAWDLDELRTAYGEFIERWRDAAVPVEPRDALTTRIRLVHDWRSFLFLDPGLPAALLPEDWRGSEAAAVFRGLYDAVDDAAWQFYESLTAAAPPELDTNGHRPSRPDDSPFAAGLQALSNT